MKADDYAHAILKLAESGVSAKDAVQKVRAVLDKSNRTGLWPHVYRAFLRLAERETRRNASVLSIANKGHEKDARKESGAHEAELVIDENLIGGWRFEDKETLTDASFKKQLLSLYNRATQ